MRMHGDFIYPRLPRKQIELWGIKSTSGHIKSKRQTFTILIIKEVGFKKKIGNGETMAKIKLQEDLVT